MSMPFIADLGRELASYSEARQRGSLRDALAALGRAQEAFDLAFTRRERLEDARTASREPYVPRLPPLPDESANWTEAQCFADALRALSREPPQGP